MTDLLTLGVLGFQLGIVVVLLEAVRRRDIAAAVNALVVFGLAVLPALIERLGPAALGRDVVLGPELPLWIAVAGLLHAVGMLGPYDSVWWWDSVTHTVSAALAAALVYSALVVVVAQPGYQIALPGAVPLLTVLLTLAAGVFWELIELVAREVGEHFDIEPVLVHYGWRDTGFDLVFDAVGALVVVALDLRLFVPVAEAFPGLTASLVWWGSVVIVAGSVVLGVLFVLSTAYRA